MALLHREINPLTVYGLRQLDFCPPHFEKINFNLLVTTKDITDWIYENTDGRFYVGPELFTGIGDLTVGFEIHSEASYFGICLSHINKPKYS